MSTAFPITRTAGGVIIVLEEGLTKREYFAAAAMQGILASDVDEDCEVVAWAVNAANALMAELEKREDD